MRTESKVGERGGWGQERRHVRALTTRLSDLISFLIFNFNAAFNFIFNEPYFRTIKTIVHCANIFYYNCATFSKNDCCVHIAMFIKCMYLHLHYVYIIVVVILLLVDNIFNLTKQSLYYSNDNNRYDNVILFY